MANRHFGEIGDIWKHLPLAEVLALENPRRYWESHAGAAQYALTPSLGRDYGAVRFFERGARSPRLSASVFWRTLDALKAADRRLTRYPGSPLIAMQGSGADRYLFCDLDGDSLADIRRNAEVLGLPPENVTCVQGDGVATLWQAATRLSGDEAAATLALIDPYRPFEANADGRTALDLFAHLSARGVKTVLWYGYDTPAGREQCWRAIETVVDTLTPAPVALWCGEINLAGLWDPDFTINPGVLGCGILTSNLSTRATAACAELGMALAESYRGHTFPTGQSGAIDFESIPVANRGNQRGQVPSMTAGHRKGDPNEFYL